MRSGDQQRGVVQALLVLFCFLNCVCALADSWLIFGPVAPIIIVALALCSACVVDLHRRYKRTR